jgi:5-oxoprolinase (ATP-hydrolysing)
VYFEDWIDDDGRGLGPWKVACTMSKKDGILKLDFTGMFDKLYYRFCDEAIPTGTDPQSPSSVNYYLSHNMSVVCIGYIVQQLTTD